MLVHLDNAAWQLLIEIRVPRPSKILSRPLKHKQEKVKMPSKKRKKLKHN